MNLSRHCTEELHGFCREDATTCACPTCHLGPCDGCGATNLRRIYGGLCAVCYRDACRRAPAHVEACEKCGQAGAFRNPQTRRNEFLCLECHVASGEYLAIAGTGGRQLIADCLGADESDSRHDWAHIKSARFVCAKCSARKWDPKLRERLRRQWLSPRN